MKCHSNVTQISLTHSLTVYCRQFIHPTVQKVTKRANERTNKRTILTPFDAVEYTKHVGLCAADGASPCMRYAMRCYAMLCDAMRCYAMLCDAMRCYANARWEFTKNKHRPHFNGVIRKKSSLQQMESARGTPQETRGWRSLPMTAFPNIPGNAGK